MTPICFPKKCGTCKFTQFCPTYREAIGKPMLEEEYE